MADGTFLTGIGLLGPDGRPVPEEFVADTLAMNQHEEMDYVDVLRNAENALNSVGTDDLDELWRKIGKTRTRIQTQKSTLKAMGECVDDMLSSTPSLRKTFSTPNFGSTTRAKARRAPVPTHALADTERPRSTRLRNAPALSDKPPGTYSVPSFNAQLRKLKSKPDPALASLNRAMKPVHQRSGILRSTPGSSASLSVLSRLR